MDSQGAKRYERGIVRATSILMYLGTSMLLIMMFLGAADVIGRYIFNAPINGTIEVFEILLPVLALCGLAYTQKEKGHLKVDLLYSRFSPRRQSIIGLGISIWSIAIFLLIAWRGILVAISYYEQGRVLSNIHVPIYLVQLLVPVGAVLICLVYIVDISHFIINLRKEK